MNEYIIYKQIYADDVSTINRRHGTCKTAKRELDRETTEEINRQNEFERSWKIKTNINKFKVIPISRRDMGIIEINENTNLRMEGQGKLLGYNITRTSTQRGLLKNVEKAKIELAKLMKFRKLNRKTKANLYKILIRPLLEYPPIPTNAVSKNCKGKLTVVQNKAIKFILNHRWRENGHYNARRGHREAGIEPLNVRIRERASKIWHKWENSNHPIMDQIRILDNQNVTENSRFPSSRMNLMRRELPLFKRN